jgi:hypothetical protein
MNWDEYWNIVRDFPLRPGAIEVPIRYHNYVGTFWNHGNEWIKFTVIYPNGKEVSLCRSINSPTLRIVDRKCVVGELTVFKITDPKTQML